ncbi:hypothetical protein BT69DRAFT_491239 [Atractiella rhizophila]|nr:hypothetical protein BT69DRAFT_491239 [Atractiella rhizophila]
MLVDTARVAKGEEEELEEGTFDYERILGDEVTRIIDLVSPATETAASAGAKLVRVKSTKAALERFHSVREAREKEKREKEANRTSEEIEREKRDFAAKRFKRRSFSLDLAMGKVGSGGKLGTVFEGQGMKSEVFGEKDDGNAGGWDDFANAGFAPLTFEKDDNGLSLTPPGSPTGTAKRTALKKHKTTTAVPNSITVDDGVKLIKAGGESLFDAPKKSTRPSIPTIQSASFGEFEESFADVWMESLGDPLVAAAWPSTIIGSLKQSLISKLGNRFNWLLIDMELVPFHPPPAPEPSETSVVSSPPTSISTALPSEAVVEKKEKEKEKEHRRGFFRRKSTTASQSEKEKEREKRKSAIFSTPSFLRSKSSHRPEGSDSSATTPPALPTSQASAKANGAAPKEEKESGRGTPVACLRGKHQMVRPQWVLPRRTENLPLLRPLLLSKRRRGKRKRWERTKRSSQTVKPRFASKTTSNMLIHPHPIAVADSEAKKPAVADVAPVIAVGAAAALLQEAGTTESKEDQQKTPEAEPVTQKEAEEAGLAVEKADLEQSEIQKPVPEEQAQSAAEGAEEEARFSADNAEQERIEAERLTKEAETARIAKEAREAEEVHLAKEAEEQRVEAERLAEEARKAEEEARLAAEQAEQERLEAEKLEAERLAKEEAERAAEEARKAEEERVAEEARLAAEKAEQERLEAERLAREAAEQAEQERLEAERVAKEEAERLETERIAEEARLASEKAEQERIEAERLANEAAEKAEQERLEAERRAKGGSRSP